MNIRPFKSSDTEKMVELMQSFVPEYFAEAEINDFKFYLSNEVEDYFIVEEIGKIIACGGINYFRDVKLARISWDMVDRNFHGKGVGRQLLEYRLNTLSKQEEIQTIQVRTSQLAYPFYQKVGFKLMKRQANFWAKGLELYLMEKPNL